MTPLSRRLLCATVLSLAWSAPAYADDPRLAAAIRQYQSAALGRARELLRPLTQDDRLATADRSLAYQYLAATCFAQADTACARAALADLLVLDPAAQMNPSVFVPELLALLEEVRPPAPAPSPALVVAPPPVLVQRSRTPGAVMIGAGVALLAGGAYGIGRVALNATDYSRQQAGNASPTVTRAQSEQDKVIYPLALGAALTGLALSGVGIVWVVSASDQGAAVGVGGQF